MNEKSLKVTMLGTFSMEYEGKTVSFERNSATKANQLMQILICYRDGIGRDQLIEKLFGGEDIADTSNSLRAVVFRLRKLLKQSGFPDDNAIQIKQGIYRLSPEFIVDCDIHNFEKAVNEAEMEGNDIRRYILLKKCTEIYTGVFLPMLNGVEWAIILSVKYKNMYFACVRELCEMSKAQRDYETLLWVSREAASLYPFDEWQTYQMDALVALGRIKEAAKLYEETGKLMFEELGVSLPEHMTEQMKKLGKQIRNNTDTIDVIVQNLQEEKNVPGAYFCAYPNFVENYRFVKRVIERTGQSACLLLCTITDGKGYALDSGERVEMLAHEVESAIRHAIRRGDLYTRYSDNQYLILLMEIKQEDCRNVVERINEKMSKESRKNYLSYHVVAMNSDLGESASLCYDIEQNVWRKEDEYSE